MNLEELKSMAGDIRVDIVKMVAEAGSGHPGGSLSAADIMCALYFGGVLKHDAENPKAEDRDRFLLSKGHAAPALYATLAEAGYFPKEELATLRKLHSRLQGHPDCKKLPGVEASTGSLGQGLSIAAGMALGLKLNGSESSVFTLMGDGECQEGQVWEAAMFAAHKGLDNLVAIVDHNHSIESLTNLVYIVAADFDNFPSESTILSCCIFVHNVLRDRKSTRLNSSHRT